MEAKESKTRKKAPKTGFEFAKVAVGFFLLLGVAACLLSPGTHLFGFAFIFVFTIGWFPLYLLSGYLVFLAITLIFNRRMSFRKGHIFLGFILIFLGSMLLAAHLGNGGNESGQSISVFMDAFRASSENLGKSLSYNPTLAGGLFGYFISGIILDSVGLWLLYVLASALITVGGVIILSKLFYSLFKVSAENRKKRKKAREKERKHQQKEEALGRMQKEREREATPFISPEDIDNSFFEGEGAEKWTSPLDRYRFTPASSNPLPSASSISDSKGKKSPIIDPTYSAKEVSGVTIDTRAPLTPIGLQEAVFEPFNSQERRADQTPLEAEQLPNSVENPAKPELNFDSSNDIPPTPVGSSVDDAYKTPAESGIPSPYDSLGALSESGPRDASSDFAPSYEPKPAQPVEEPKEEKALDAASLAPVFDRVAPADSIATPKEPEPSYGSQALAPDFSADLLSDESDYESEPENEPEPELEPEPAIPDPVEEARRAAEEALQAAAEQRRLAEEELRKAEEARRAAAEKRRLAEEEAARTPAPVPAPQPTAPAPAPSASPNPNVTTFDPENKFVMPKANPLPAYTAPQTDLLQTYDDMVDLARIEQVCCQRAAAIDKKFLDLHVGAHVCGYTVGPSVTRFDIETDPNVSVASITRYMKDISKVLEGVSCRFAEIVPGKTTSAIEVVNRNEDRRMVPFSECFAGLPTGPKYNMAIPFGVNIENEVVWGDLSKFPHMLVAGTTGSGKSIFIQGILMSLIMRNRPEDVKLMLVDPKRVEFAKYRDVPHLLCPIIKEPKESRIALGKLCDEMDRRYGLFEKAEVSEIREFNADYCEPNGLEKLPFIVLVVDEYADLVEQEKDVGSYVLRLSAKARACGIHLIICTQRPDVKVITGTIKNNLNTRVGLHLKTAIDSGTILNAPGAEELLDRGDMLVDCDKISREFVRVQGCMVHNHEISRVTNFIKSQFTATYDPYFSDFTDPEEKAQQSAVSGINPNGGNSDINLKEGSFEVVYEYVRDEIMKMDSISISKIQRQFRVGYPRASDIFNKLIDEGIVAPKTDSPNSSKPCEVLVHSLAELEGKEEVRSGPGSLSSSYVTPSDPYGDDGE